MTAVPDYAPAAPAASLPVTRPLSVSPPWLLLAAGFVLATATVATALPLAVYTVTLATFGLAHVLSELRYVDSRFSPRVGWRLRTGMIVLLAGVVTNRVLYIGGITGYEVRIFVELGLVVALGATVMPQLIQRGWWAAGIGVLVIGAIGVGGALWPVTTLLCLAVLHNVTPVGFLAERLRGRTRRWAMLACLLVFVLVPAFIASGWPVHWLRQFGWIAPEFSVIPSAGGLESHFGQYLPDALLTDWWTAVSLFAAAVFLQCMHYAVVIHVLPRLDTDRDWTNESNTVPWPKRHIFLVMVVGIASLLLVGFLASFGQARKVYGLAASVHAWIEIPILLLALALPFRAAAAGKPAPGPALSD